MNLIVPQPFLSLYNNCLFEVEVGLLAVTLPPPPPPPSPTVMVREGRKQEKKGISSRRRHHLIHHEQLGEDGSVSGCSSSVHGAGASGASATASAADGSPPLSGRYYGHSRVLGIHPIRSLPSHEGHRLVIIEHSTRDQA
ncbi:hypothetical protein SAY86_027128 [Trapa natans]|uniref:Uncharacterized protein n=1 Tax=Trapa natans TaxID=22666 RepID=A0AAN7QK73_TRANT|nr:hypothetical protein SAY86_027128 [Trapa natans]